LAVDLAEDLDAGIPEAIGDLEGGGCSSPEVLQGDVAALLPFRALDLAVSLDGLGAERSVRRRNEDHMGLHGLVGMIRDRDHEISGAVVLHGRPNGHCGRLLLGVLDGVLDGDALLGLLGRDFFQIALVDDARLLGRLGVLLVEGHLLLADLDGLLRRSTAADDDEHRESGEVHTRRPHGIPSLLESGTSCVKITPKGPIRTLGAIYYNTIRGIKKQ
jgi:hypothetical protein